MSAAGGALALLGTGSVALSSVHAFGAASRRQPVTLTMSTFVGDCAAALAVTARMQATVFMARIIAFVVGAGVSWRGWRTPRIGCAAIVAFVIASFARAAPASAHDVERTRVVLTFSQDGSFVLDVANDPNWLKLRLERFTGPFTDRIVLWVDGHEIHPTSVEYLAPPPAAPGDVSELGVYRMRGQMPIDARSLRWYYGLVIDPYPLTIHRAEGRLEVEEIAGGAWSDTIDLTGQFRKPLLTGSNRAFASILAVVALLLLPLVLRMRSLSSR